MPSRSHLPLLPPRRRVHLARVSLLLLPPSPAQACRRHLPLSVPHRGNRGRMRRAHTHTHSRPRSLPLHLSLPLFLPPSLPTTHPTPPHPQPPTLLLSCVAAACDGQDGSAGDSASGEASAKRCRHPQSWPHRGDAGTSQANSSYLECSIVFPICAFRAQGLPKCLGFGQDGWSSFGSGAASSVTVSSAHQRFPECTSEKPSSLSEGSASVCAGDVSLELLHQIHAQMAEMDWENAERDQKGAAEWLEMERIWNSICST